MYFNFFLNKNIKLNFLLFLFSSIFSLYLFQIILISFDIYDRDRINKKKNYQFNKKSEFKYDTRNRYDYFKDQRKLIEILL